MKTNMSHSKSRRPLEGSHAHQCRMDPRSHMKEMFDNPTLANCQQTAKKAQPANLQDEPFE